MIHPIISIIATAYQVEAYIEECLDSILLQTFTNFEVLLVDDGSTDDTGRICDEYAARDERIRVFHQTNQGPPAARKTGLDNSRGDYIAIVDCDDILLSRDYLKLLYDAMMDNDADMSVCNKNTFYHSDGVPNKIKGTRKILILSGKDVFREAIHGIRVSLFSQLYAKLYKRESFNKIDYPDDLLTEEAAICHHIVYPMERIAFMDYPMYGWRRRPGSVLKGKNSWRMYIETCDALDNCIDFMSRQGDDVAVMAAKKRKCTYAISFFYDAIEDGTVHKIPEKMRPQETDYERVYPHYTIMKMIGINDPDMEFSVTRDLIRTTVDRGVMLLSIACSQIMWELKDDLVLQSQPKLLMELANVEGLSYLTSEAIAAAVNVSCEERYTYLNNRDYMIRKSIINMNAYARIENRLEKDGVPFFSFVPHRLISTYPKPWYRDNNDWVVIIDNNSIDTVKAIMKEEGFEEISNFPVEAMRVSEIQFINKSRSRITFSIGAPFVLFGSCRNYLSCLCNDLIHKNREMTTAEYAVIIVAKLHGIQILTTSARLKDIIDLAVIMHAEPYLIHDDVFIDKIRDLGVEDTWNACLSLCNSIIGQKDICSKMHEKDRAFLEKIIKSPQHRMMNLRRITSPRMEETFFIQRIEYMVLREKKISYLINSKAACSSILACLTGEDFEDDHSVHSKTMIKGFIKSNLEREEKNFFCFTFVRNPFSRLVSCYESKYHVDRERYENVDDFKEYLDGYLAIDNGFTEFVNKVCSLPYQMMDIHFRPQYELIYDKEGKCRCDYIGRFEKLEEEFEPIRSRYKLKILQTLNKSHTTNWMEYYTEETAKLVYETFKKDFIEFEYEDSYKDLVEYIKRGV